MKFFSISLALVALKCVATFGLSDQADAKLHDSTFWQRFVQEAKSMSIETKAPAPIPIIPPVPGTSAPTPGPTQPSITPSPTPGPTQPSITPSPTPGPTQPSITPGPTPIPVSPPPTPGPTPTPVSPPPTPGPTPTPVSPPPVSPPPSPGPTPTPVSPPPVSPPPTPGPTPAPVTPPPTPGPTPAPVTPPPTPGPTPAPVTPPPTPGPTPAPVSPPPTPGPTPAPVTPPPTPGPTPAPTVPVPCDISVDVKCTKCNATYIPPNTCTSNLTDLQFLFTNCTCLCSRNPQGGMDTCVQSLNFTGEAVDVQCFDTANNPLEVSIPPGGLFQGGIFLVRDPSGGILPDTIRCSFIQPGGIVQTVTIDTGVDSTLSLLDQFGSAQVVSCGEQTCLEELCYLYTVTNKGPTTLDLTTADRIFNGNTTDSFLPFLREPLASGTSTSVRECRNITACRAFDVNTTVFAEGELASGAVCSASATNFLEITPPPTSAPTAGCNINVDIACVTSGGQDCRSIGARNCTSGNIEEQFCFTYTINNVGSVTANITSAISTFNGASTSILSKFTSNSVGGGKSISTTPADCQTVSVCGSFNLSNSVDVIGKSGRSNCTAFRTYAFSAGSSRRKLRL